MTVKELLTGILNTDLYEALVWSIWYFRPTRVACKECIERKAEGSGKAPDCLTCGLPTAKLMKQHFGKKENCNVKSQ